jgi:hypothetical protein
LALAQFTQQGPKLVGTGPESLPDQTQGWSVALSADGNTAIVGVPVDVAPRLGGAWVYTRSGGVWTQQGPKLVGNDAVTSHFGVHQGTSVALSADGNTAILGGPDDNQTMLSPTGAAWVFTRSNGIWTQQGSKLVGIDATFAGQGTSVSLSADGNTAIVGGPDFNSLNSTVTGATWVYTRSNGVWTQQGSKLVGTGAVSVLSADGNTVVGGFLPAAVYTRSGGVWTQQASVPAGTGAVGNAEQGTSLSLSADGNTVIVGGPGDNSNAGAAWIFTRSGNVWTQQGSKLVGTGAVGAAQQGNSVSLSADGNTALVGGPYDNPGFVGGPSENPGIGAAWVFTRSNGVWTQQASKLVGIGAVGTFVHQGWSVALSGDGNTAIVGGPLDNAPAGAAWVFVQPPTVSFSAFTAKLNIYFTPNQYGFALLSNFTLGSTSNGINPVTETVTLQIGTFTITIPPGSFQGRRISVPRKSALSPGDWTFVGVINGVTLEAVILLTAPHQYIFGVTAQKVNLIGTQTPVTVTLTIGNDSGTTQAINF